MSTDPRHARIEFRTSEATKNLLMQAASLNGVDLTTFFLVSAIDKARQVVKDHTSINFSAQAQLTLAQVLRNPGQPTLVMKKLFALPSFEKVDT